MACEYCGTRHPGLDLCGPMALAYARADGADALDAARATIARLPVERLVARREKQWHEYNRGFECL